jgi:hypothetical protein
VCVCVMYDDAVQTATRSGDVRGGVLLVMKNASRRNPEMAFPNPVIVLASVVVAREVWAFGSILFLRDRMNAIQMLLFQSGFLIEGIGRCVTDRTRTRTGEPSSSSSRTVRAPQVVGKTTRKEAIDQAE